LEPGELDGPLHGYATTDSITGSSLVKIPDKRETLFIGEDCMTVLLF
jgi:hypothetical protein